MPLTQQRLIDAILAADDYKHAFNELVRRLSLAHEEHPNDLRLQGLSLLTAEDLLERPHQSPTTIAVELERIRFTRRANERRRHKKQESLIEIEAPQDEISTPALGLQSFFESITKK